MRSLNIANTLPVALKKVKRLEDGTLHQRFRRADIIISTLSPALSIQRSECRFSPVAPAQ